MAVAKSAVSAGVTAVAAITSATQVEVASTITVGASDTFLLLCVSCNSPTPGTGTAHWDNGGSAQAMTAIGQTTNAGSNLTIAFFGLVSPTAGAKKFDWTFPSISGSADSYHFAISFTGTITSSVAAATEGFQSASSSAANAAVTSSASVPSGDMAVAGYDNANGYSNAFTASTNPGDGGVAIGKNETLTDNMAGEYYSGSGSTIAASAVQGASGAFVALVVGIKAAVAGATFIAKNVSTQQAVKRGAFI